MSFVKKKEIKSLPLPPGSLGLPIIRSLSFLKEGGPIEHAKKRHKKYGSIFKSYIFGQQTIYVCGAEACRFVLDNENKYFINNVPSNVVSLMGKLSIINQTRETHNNRRKILRKTFTSQYVEKQIGKIDNITQNYCKRWEYLNNFAWYFELRNYSLDIACKVFLGIEQASASELGYLEKTLKDGLLSFISLPWTKLGQALKSRQKIVSTLDKLIDQRCQENSLQDHQDILSLLLKARDNQEQSLSRIEVQDQIINLVFGGHASMASALTSFCLLLAQNPDILEKCRQEQNNLNFSTPLTLDNLKEMNYLENVLKEVLRKIPPILGGFRTIVKDCSFQGYLFPKGWQVIYQIPVNHQESKSFTCPDKFDPERFNVAKSQDNLSAYMPYGFGKRRCLGESLANLELKIFAVNLIRKYDWKLSDNQDLDINWYPYPWPKDGLKVQFRRL